MGSIFGSADKDNLEYEIMTFLEENTMAELLDVVKWCVEIKEDEYRSEKGEANENSD